MLQNEDCIQSYTVVQLGPEEDSEIHPWRHWR